MRPIATDANGASWTFAADLDGDGDIDVLSASSLDDKIAWYENLGGGTFGIQQIITTDASFAAGVFAADVDGDGDEDVVSASRDDNKIAWYENIDGAGTFGAQQVIATSAVGARSVVAADLDNDGDLDIAAASAGDDTVAWFENQGGQFAFATTDTAPAQIVEGERATYCGSIRFIVGGWGITMRSLRR